MKQTSSHAYNYNYLIVTAMRSLMRTGLIQIVSSIEDLAQHNVRGLEGNIRLQLGENIACEKRKALLSVNLFRCDAFT